MLKEFRVRNFMNFQEELIFSLADDKKYDFNHYAIKNKIVKNAVIVGSNAIGKSNLGKAVLDLTNHLTDATETKVSDGLYTNFFSNDLEAHFSYTFQFGKHTVYYKYSKMNVKTVTRENLLIDGKEVIRKNYNQVFVKLPVAEKLDLDQRNMTMSLVKYVYTHADLEMEYDENLIFVEFMEFVRGMLFATATDEKTYAGFTAVGGNLTGLICELEDGVKDLQLFLKEMGIEYELVAREESKVKKIYCKFNKKEIPLSRVCSSGTRALIYFYYWYKQKKSIQFLYLDEFDAFYHTRLSHKILEKLTELEDVQTIVTTHNTDMISNEILRPDCYFELKENGIKPFYQSTCKILREAHNLQKMYKEGAFDE